MLSWQVDCGAQIPPPRRETYFTDSRISSIWKTWRLVELLCPNYFQELWKFHYFHPSEVEEETLIFPGAFLLTGLAPLATLPGGQYDKWYHRQDNKSGAYKYLRAFLQVLSSSYGPGAPEEDLCNPARDSADRGVAPSDREAGQAEGEEGGEGADLENASPIGGENMSPSGRWVLKCPFHALWLDSVVEEFPDADFIVTHRPADQMVPSWAKFQAMTFRMLYDENSHSDSREVAKLTADSFEEKLERLEVERSRQEAQGRVRLGPTRLPAHAAIIIPWHTACFVANILVWSNCVVVCVCVDNRKALLLLTSWHSFGCAGRSFLRRGLPPAGEGALQGRQGYLRTLRLRFLARV